MHYNKGNYYWYDTAPNFIEERDVKACDEIHVNSFTAPIIRMMIVKDFLGEDQNADI
ncbi:hypothetical protein C1645_769363 [Glomus cerebriforme]|uniref:Uncharacterized protein n=1 Tax=Glomus cerebriforme TaxID=658196 RepID=A0A397T040_9GLOM|nr:hypothetical protein C1645_769363 [Glomus cerebriforme]